MDTYVRGEVLGKGSFGCAVLVTNELDNTNYVIKEIDMSRMPKSERKGAEQEAKLLMALNHPNIVRCLECFTHRNKLCIVMDWCSEGDLYGLLQKRRGQQLSEDTILDWLAQICLGLKHVHARKILHGDIKTQNVFMSTGGRLKLGDFGVSKVLNSTFQLATTAVGAPYYLTPEFCQNKKYNQKSDIWSLGCVLYELATLKHAFEGPNMRAIISKIIKGSYTPMPATRSRELRELCDRMLHPDWQKRPYINEILDTPILKARTQKFVSATPQAHEFSRTIIHGRPRPGQLVVGPGVAAAAAAAGVPAGGPAGQAPSPSKAGPSAPPQPPAAAGAGPRPFPGEQLGAARVGSAAAPARQSSNVMPPRGGAAAAAAAGPGAGRGLAVAAAAPGRPAVAAPVLGGGGAAALKQGQDSAAAAAAAARAKAAEAAKQREDVMMALAAKRAADAEANAKRKLKRAKAREMAALGAQRVIKRLKLEEQRRKLERELARLKVGRKKREAASRAKEERRAKAAEEEARTRLKDEEARRQREMEAKRKKAEEEARKKDAKKAAKVQVPAGRPPWRQWSRTRNDDGPARGRGGAAAAADEPGPAGAGAGGGAAAGRRSGTDDYLSAEQRRAVFEEQRAAAERNRRAAQGAECHGGLAEFLGVPRDTEEGDQGRQQAAAGRPSPPKAGGGGGAAAGQDISPDARRAAYLKMRAAVERNRAAAESAERGGNPPGRQSPGAAPGGPAGRAVSPLGQGGRKRKLEIRGFQEVGEARKRNKRQRLAEVLGEREEGGA